VSCAGSAAAVLYLSMRQVCDGQDLAELWSPGVVEGAMSESMAGRGALTRHAAGDAGAQPPAEEVEED
jgi:hypothetical protein